MEPRPPPGKLELEIIDYSSIKKWNFIDTYKATCMVSKQRNHEYYLKHLSRKKEDAYIPVGTDSYPLPPCKDRNKCHWHEISQGKRKNEEVVQLYTIMESSFELKELAKIRKTKTAPGNFHKKIVIVSLQES